MYNFVKCQNTILQFRFFCTIDPNFIIEKNYVHLVFLIVSKANDVVKIVWTLSGFNFSAIAGLWRSLEASLWLQLQRLFDLTDNQKNSEKTVASEVVKRPLETVRG